MRASKTDNPDKAPKASNGRLSMGELLRLQLQLGWRNIWRQKKRAFIVMSAGGVGMLGIMLTVGFMNGFRGMMLDAGIKSGLGHLQIRPAQYSKSRKTGMSLQNSESIDKVLQRQSHKLNFNYTARYEREGLLKLDEKVRGVKIIGIDPKSEQKISLYHKWISDGSFLDDSSVDNFSKAGIDVLLGQVNAKYFEVEIGDYIILSLTGKNGDAVSIRGLIKGFFRSIAEPIDKYTVLVRRNDLSRLYNGLTVKQPQDAKKLTEYFALLGPSLESSRKIKLALQKEMQQLGAIPMTYRELEPGIYKMLDMSDTSMSIFYVILMMGFAFVLMNTVLMSIYERTREFGILRAIGTPRKMVFLMILSESLLLTILGCLGGIIFGTTLNVILHHTGFSLAMFAEGMEKMGGSGSTMYPFVMMSDIFSALALAIVINLAAATYPAYRATRLIPVKAIYGR